MKQITLRLDDETFAALATEAEKEDRSINWVIRRALEQAAHPLIYVDLPPHDVPGNEQVRARITEINSPTNAEFKVIPTNGPVVLPPQTSAEPRRLPASVVTDEVVRKSMGLGPGDRPCPHPKARIFKGQCQACGLAVAE